LIGHGMPLGIAGIESGYEALFAAKDERNGFELWRAQVGGAVSMVANINQGADGLTPRLSSNPTWITWIRPGRAFFTARTERYGRELYLYTPGEVALVLDIRKGPTGSDPRELTRVGDNIVFSADDGATGRELWFSDGTPGGTHLIKAIVPGASGSSPAGFTLLPPSRFVFAATDASGDREPWISDGTAAGTAILKDIRSLGSSSPYDFVAFHGKVWFSAREPAGRVLFQTDGTAAGTMPIPASGTNPVDLTPGHPGPLAWTARNQSGNRALYVFQGGQAKEITTMPAGSRGWTIRRVTPLGAEFFFSMEVAGEGSELYRLWEHPSSGYMVSLACSIRAGARGSNPTQLAACGGRLLFRATDDEFGEEPRVWDAATSTCGLLRNIRSGPTGRHKRTGSRPSEIQPLGTSSCVFAANDGRRGRELWRTDGTPAGTRRASDIDAKHPLPELLIEDGPGEGILLARLRGARPNMPLVVLRNHHFSRAGPKAFPQMRGVLMLDMIEVPPDVLAIGMTDEWGFWDGTLDLPEDGHSMHGLQCLVFGSIEATAQFVYSTGECITGPSQDDARASASGGVDDLSNDYQITVERQPLPVPVLPASNNPPAWVALVMYDPFTKTRQLAPLVGLPDGDPRELYLDEPVWLDGVLDFSLPQYEGDPNGKMLELWLYLEHPSDPAMELPQNDPPTLPATSRMCRVWRSYC
jgi:ELWxxDGT repeat protein